MIRDINADKDLTNSIDSENWEKIVANNQEHLYDDKTNALVSYIEKIMQSNNWDTLDIIYLTLILKKSLNKLKEMGALNTDKLKSIYDYFEVIGSLIDTDKQEIERKNTCKFISKVKRKKACNT